MQRITMRAILAEPGRDPEILVLPADGLHHEEALRDVLEGNYGAIEFFRIEEGISLFVLVNDLAVALGLKANRRFPGKDSNQIIFGRAIFIAAYNGELPEREGTLDMPEEMCRMFIEQIKLNFAPCDGTEKPRPEDEIYYENQGDPEQEKAFRWVEISAPKDPGPALEAGRAKYYSAGENVLLEINGRFFRQLEIYTGNTKL